MTGPNAAGKGEVADFLRRQGFTVTSLSDVIREEARAQGFPAEREHLIRIGNQLREKGGAGVLAERVMPRLGPRHVVDSIRNPAEVTVLRRLEAFVLVGVRATLVVRFERSLARGRPGDPTTVDAFRKREEQENSGDPAAQQLAATFALADHVIDNDDGLSQLHRDVGRLIERLDRRTSSRGAAG